MIDTVPPCLGFVTSAVALAVVKAVGVPAPKRTVSQCDRLAGRGAGIQKRGASRRLTRAVVDAAAEVVDRSQHRGSVRESERFGRRNAADHRRLNVALCRAPVAEIAEGANLALPALPLQTPLKVQLVNSTGTCWETEYEVGDVIDNSTQRFKARED